MRKDAELATLRRQAEVLARAVRSHHARMGEMIMECRICHHFIRLSEKAPSELAHAADCPVLVARQVLGEEP